MGFNNNLIKLRRVKGLSQEELGNEIGVARQTVSKWELGETTPEMDKLLALSSLFEVSIDEMLDNKEFITERAENPQRFDWKKVREKIRTEYEYKSEKTIGSIPLVHINMGKGKRTAKGVLAIGNKAYGLIAIGGIAGGLFSLGFISLGLISLGVFALSILFSMGILSLAPVSFGCFAIGFFAIGGVSIGIYSVGAIAIAKNIASGGCAIGHLAIGEVLIGTTEVVIQSISPETESVIRETILREFPNIWEPLLKIFSSIY